MSAHVTELLSVFLDAELTSQDHEQVETHLAGCPDCRRYLDELRELDALARKAPVPELPGSSDLAARVRSRIEPSRRPRLQMQWWWAAAAGLALAVLPLYLVREQRKEAPAVFESSPATKTQPSADTAPPAPVDAAGAGNELHKKADRAKPHREKAEREDRLTGQDEAGSFAAPPAAPPAEPEAPAAAEAAEDGDTRRAEESALDAQVAGAEGKREQGPVGRAFEDFPAAARAPKSGTIQGGAPERDAFASADDTLYRALAAQPLRTGDEARRARDAWASYRRRYPHGAHAEEARLAEIDAAAAAYRFDGREDDLTRFRTLANGYLSATPPEASGAVRVRRLLEAAEAP
jgi:hypothetical protein